MHTPLQRLTTLKISTSESVCYFHMYRKKVCCLGENQFGSPPDKLIKTILEKMLKIFMVNPKIYPLNKVISHVKIILRSY